MIKDYSEELTEDIEEIKNGGANEENINDYKTRYEKFFSQYLSAKSNCFSSMITGPANFPTRRHEKANRGEQRHYEIFREWRIRAKKAIIRKAQPPKTFLSELERYREELEGMKKNHDLMKQGNKIIAQANKEGKDISEYFKATFNLQNNNANMKRVEQRIKELEKKEALKNSTPVNEYNFEGGKMVINYEIDRIQIFFNNRPTKEELTQWKEKGLNTFNWSPSNIAWQRKITANALYSANKMINKQ